MNCVICSKDCEGEFCKWHKISYDRLVESFKYWRKAKNISWKDYLREVIDNPNSGNWAKEVASYIFKKES